ncbi:MAG: DUF4911 domain-containing protein [Deltaproteobacteria bacterium]|nr:MAG: DUF4911 domain-containing protein [Deltaproteobacteria bacterium]RLB95654.1 MAG: DUF4911 domain-containing protein [Deltaproteobacteria bacterium]
MVIASQIMVVPEATIKRYYRIDRREIHYLKFILEGYDGVAAMKTLDPQEGLVALHIGPGCEEEVNMIIEDVGRRVQIETAEILKGDAL